MVIVRCSHSRHCRPFWFLSQFDLCFEVVGSHTFNFRSLILISGMTAANQGRVAPYGAVLGVSDPTAVRRQWIVRAAAVATVALACAACVGLLVHERGVSGEAAELGGAYYAVAKPPAFNFNREYPAIPQPCPVCAASRRSIRSRFQDPLNEGSPAAPLGGLFLDRGEDEVAQAGNGAHESRRIQVCCDAGRPSRMPSGAGPMEAGAAPTSPPWGKL